jgi:hypothetical protein
MPPDSRIPDSGPGSATPGDYDRYFSLDRQPTDLRQWTAGCLSLEKDLLSDLEETELNEHDRNQILVGLVIVYRATLERWMLAAGEPTAASEPDSKSTAHAADR